MTSATPSPMSPVGFAWRMLLVQFLVSSSAGLVLYALGPRPSGALWEHVFLGLTWLGSCSIMQHWAHRRNGAYAEDCFARKAVLWFCIFSTPGAFLVFLVLSPLLLAATSGSLLILIAIVFGVILLSQVFNYGVTRLLLALAKRIHRRIVA